MSAPVSSQQDLYDLWITVLQDEAPELTDTLDGSTIDSLAGVFSVAGLELIRTIILQFNKCFFSLATGPENPGDPDDLQTLAVDRFGDAFARPGAVAAVDTITFSRPTNAGGSVTILAGSIVKTKPDANGSVNRYATAADCTLTALSLASDLTVSVGITCTVAGSQGNATVGTINVIETSLSDTTIVCSNAGNATGEDAEDDADYRQTIANLIQGLRGATRAAIEATAKTVAGVVVATAVESELDVIQYVPSTNTIAVGAEGFRIPFVTLYIADNTGSASSTLINEVYAAIDPIRAYGVHIFVAAAVPVTVNWTGHLVLNPAGPNFALLSHDTSLIVNDMTDYLARLPAATNFVIATANAAILAIWGPGGTNDLTSFSTTLPTGDVSIASNQKAIPGTIATA